MKDACTRCEELLQPFLDRELTEREHAEAEEHLDRCTYCRKRYRFELSLRRYVRVAAREEISPELKARLAAMRTAVSD